jgi:hypothetical protein
MHRLLRDNGLSIALFGLFIASLLGQVLTGRVEYNDDRQQHGRPGVGYAEYLTSGHFEEAVFENWESEFLQMGAYVLLTVVLRQRGSAESKGLDGDDPVDADPTLAGDDPAAPWPVRQGGLVLQVYRSSLGIALFLLFALSFGMHANGGARAYSAEQVEHGEAAVSTIEYLGTARFWFESFQNWQSEFFSIGAVVVLSIFLRQQGSPESKPVAAPHRQTGSG